MGVTFIAPQGVYTAPAKLVSKTITENNTYNAIDDNANGYSSVTVNVEGGGGSSDFSIAEVTIRVASGEANTVLLMTQIEDSGKRTGIVPFEVTAPSTQKTYNVPLFKGHCLIRVKSGDVDSLTGNVTRRGDWLDVTGNCSLTGYYVMH